MRTSITATSACFETASSIADAAVTRGPDHLEPVVVAEQQRQRVDEEPVIVDDHDPHGSGLKVSGHELGPAPVSPFPGRGCRSNH